MAKAKSKKTKKINQSSPKKSKLLTKGLIYQTLIAYPNSLNYNAHILISRVSGSDIVAVYFSFSKHCNFGYDVIETDLIGFESLKSEYNYHSIKFEPYDPAHAKLISVILAMSLENAGGVLPDIYHELLSIAHDVDISSFSESDIIKIANNFVSGGGDSSADDDNPDQLDFTDLKFGAHADSNF